MRGTIALLITLALGGMLILATVQQRRRYQDVPSVPTTEETMGERARVTLPPPRPLELTDVYTSEAARLTAESRAVGSGIGPGGTPTAPEPASVPESEEALPEAIPLAGLLGAEATDGELPIPVEPPEGQPLGEEAAAVLFTVEAFLRDAVELGDVETYVSLLDDEFLYSYNNGTPEQLEDDRVLRRDQYLQWIVPELFQPWDAAEVDLSPPRDLVWIAPDLVAVRYDYDMRFRSADRSRRFVGTADLLLRRDETDAWRVLEWGDAPPDRQNWQLRESRP
ncbi:MAG: hypothetical protein KatS3mg115_0395 [Candidatus Poribacteria bacterium]|nr:MAG: hypothetical protein KatS3mg115_0395 [Candidatus Poribacteria bacterium]